MLILEVIAIDGQPPVSPLRVQLDETGGTIGRAPTNKLALPDPNRTVSRVHAQIVRRDGVVVVIARGANELIVDDHPLDIGEETPLGDGSVIRMGSFAICARHAPPREKQGA